MAHRSEHTHTLLTGAEAREVVEVEAGPLSHCHD